MVPLRRLLRRLTPGPDRFLGAVRGVIHVGANRGRERFDYQRLGLSVLWVEAIPEVARALADTLAAFPRQRVLSYLLADVDDEELTLNIASNRGASSSILPLKAHAELWPDVEFVDRLTLRSATLPGMLAREGIAASDYDALVLDTQGAELRILEGAVPILAQFAFIQAEVADFEAYAGCPRVADLERFMRTHGFSEQARRRFAGRAGIGNYYDIVYRRERGRH